MYAKTIKLFIFCDQMLHHLFHLLIKLSKNYMLSFQINWDLEALDYAYSYTDGKREKKNRL